MFTIYLICFLAGVSFSALSLLTMFAHGLHHGGGHGHGHSAHAHHVGHGHAQHGPSQGQHAVAGQQQNAVAKATQNAVADAAVAGTPWLMRINITAIVLFLAIFGAVGLLLEPAHELSSLLIGGIAAACGVAGGAVVNRVLAAIVAKERPLEPVNFTGVLAQVTIPIRDGGGTGEIIYTLDGTRCCSGARSDDGVGIGRGTEVVIVRYDKGIAYVAAFDDPGIHGPSITSH
jgi:hypothetical protein